jgi:uncharacterized protein (TIGR03435 family)
MRLISLFAAAIGILYAADEPKFEAASAKRMECTMIHNSMGPGTVTLRGDPLIFVLAEAFKVKPYQVVGPSWLETECFEIIGKMPEGATSDQIPAMLQALLAERFKLAVHKEDRPGTVYALVVDKGGPKFKPAEEPNGNFRRGAPPRLMLYRAASDIRGFKGAMSMAMLANSLARGLGRPVHDLTGLQGSYEIDLAWAPDPTIDRPVPNSFAANPATGSSGPDRPTATLFTAIRESLGLKLETRKEPVEMLVIDKLERVPVEN